MLSERVMEWTRQWEQEGIEKGSLQTKQVTARNLLAEGLTVDLIARATGLSIAEVEALRPS